MMHKPNDNHSISFRMLHCDKECETYINKMSRFRVFNFGEINNDDDDDQLKAKR